MVIANSYYCGLRERRVSVIGSLLRRIENHYGEKWIGKGESSLPYIEKMVNVALKRVVMITGELDPQLYEFTSLPQTIENGLKRGVEFGIVFHKDGANFQEAKQRFLFENKKIAALARSYPNLLHLYWRSKRPESHYLVVDSDALFLEESHKPYRPRRAIAKSHSIHLGKKLEERFDELKCRRDCQSLKVD